MNDVFVQKADRRHDFGCSTVRRAHANPFLLNIVRLLTAFIVLSVSSFSLHAHHTYTARPIVFRGVVTRSAVCTEFESTS